MHQCVTNTIGIAIEVRPSPYLFAKKGTKDLRKMQKSQALFRQRIAHVPCRVGGNGGTESAMAPPYFSQLSKNITYQHFKCLTSWVYKHPQFFISSALSAVQLYLVAGANVHKYRYFNATFLSVTF